MSDTSSGNDLVDHGRIEQAVAQFENAKLSPAEAFIAASFIAMASAERLRKEAGAIRSTLGVELSRELASTEIADAISRLQDAAAPAVHGFNALMRDDMDSPLGSF